MLKATRKLHLWIGLLFAPTLIFFALSGTLQMFGLHESEGGTPAPSWIAKLAEVHKIQSIEDRPARVPSHPITRAPPTASAANEQPSKVDAAPVAVTRTSAPRDGAATRAQPHRSLPLILWFAALAVGLVVSTVIGIYMSFAYKRDRATVLALLAAGIVVPVILAFL